MPLGPRPANAPARLLALALAAGLGASVGCGGCSGNAAPNPFVTGGGGGAGGEGGATSTGMIDAGQDGGTTIGGPCVDDAQCDDGIDCTIDACDQSIGRCRFTPDDSQCDNGVYCDGKELCKNAVGCSPGVPVTCSDQTACTVDVCDEQSHGCKHLMRDADGDGDPDIHCGGGDCDDNDPNVNSAATEICGNGKDDNCDGAIDEATCHAPVNDTCLDPLVIDHAGSFTMSTIGDVFDYPTSCGIMTSASAADAVAALVLPPGPPVDVEVTATVSSGHVSVALSGQCGDAASEIACGAPFTAASGGAIARFRARGIGSPTETTTLPITVTTEVKTSIVLKVALLDPEPVATNETCGTAQSITPGVPEPVEILEPALDLGTVCTTPLGELVYAFTLAEAQDVDVYATSTDGTGLPMISLRGAACAAPEDEIACAFAKSAHVLRHALPPGTYYVGLSASAPTNVELDVELSDPTAVPDDDLCAGAPALTPGVTRTIDLGRHQDDVYNGCLAGAADAAYDLELTEASDVLLVQRVAAGDVAAVELVDATCGDANLACKTGGSSPLRATRRNVPAGSYRTISESVNGLPVQLTAYVRKAVPPTQVLFADTCDDVLTIPSSGGFFQGNTANAQANYPAGCDQSGGALNGGPDQLLKLVLDAPKRVVLDMTGSTYSTLLDVRKGTTCPGQEVPLGCTIGYYGTTSFLDLSLDAGTYFIQIDGYNGDKGAWSLDVRVVDP